MNKLTANLWAVLDVLENNSTLVQGEIDEIREHLLEATKAIESELDADRWVSVEERLPEEDGDYLVVWYCFGEMQTVTNFKYIADQRRWAFADHGYDITHWRPLPKFEVDDADA